MTRFARAEGSKASNKRNFEEATSWQDMKKDLTNQRKKRKKKTDKDVASTCIEELSTQTSLAEHSDDDTQESQSSIEGKKTKKNISLEERKKNYIVKDGVKYKVFKNGIEKPWFDLPYEENDVMTRYMTAYVKHEDVVLLDNHKRSFEEKGLTDKTIKNKMLNMERKCHNKLRIQLLKEEVSKSKKNASGSEETNLKNSPIKDSSKSNQTNLEFEENDVMSHFDGYWVKKDKIEELENCKASKLEEIVSSRSDGNDDPNLTSEEQVLLNRYMKKFKRMEHQQLLNYMSSLSYSKQGTMKKNSKGSKKMNMNKEPKPGKLVTDFKDVVRIGVHFVKKEAADRLNKLKQSLMDKGCSDEEIRLTMKNECRKEERVLKRERKFFCFRCRRVGHLMNTCPESGQREQEGVEMCFKCGSTEHMARACPSNKSGPKFSLANCFICGEAGHIARECPDNPKGLYPDGGCCHECGSVEHLKKDCPEFVTRMEDKTIKVSRFRHNMEIDAIDDELLTEETTSSKPHKRSKIIQFD